MNNYVGSIDTDSGIATILSHFSTSYIEHVVDDSLRMRFRPFDQPMPNMVDILQRQFLSISVNSPDYTDKVAEVREETFKEIIYKICSFYNLTFTGDFQSMNIEEIYGIAHILYDIFISRFTDYMINFFVSYIIDNRDSIISYLKTTDDYVKPKEVGAYSPKLYIDPNYIAIHANINTVVYNMAAYDISLETLLRYFVDPITLQRLSGLLVDNNDIYKKHYASYILDQRYSAGVLTNIKLKLQSRTQEIMNI